MTFVYPVCVCCWFRRQGCVLHVSSHCPPDEKYPCEERCIFKACFLQTYGMPFGHVQELQGNHPIQSKPRFSQGFGSLMEPSRGSCCPTFWGTTRPLLPTLKNCTCVEQPPPHQSFGKTMTSTQNQGHNQAEACGPNSYRAATSWPSRFKADGRRVRMLGTDSLPPCRGWKDGGRRCKANANPFSVFIGDELLRVVQTVLEWFFPCLGNFSHFQLWTPAKKVVVAAVYL